LSWYFSAGNFCNSLGPLLLLLPFHNSHQRSIIRRDRCASSSAFLPAAHKTLSHAWWVNGCRSCACRKSNPNILVVQPAQEDEEHEDDEKAVALAPLRTWAGLSLFPTDYFPFTFSRNHLRGSPIV
jgi:hypothetical protein